MRRCGKRPLPDHGSAELQGLHAERNVPLGGRRLRGLRMAGLPGEEYRAGRGAR